METEKSKTATAESALQKFLADQKIAFEAVEEELVQFVATAQRAIEDHLDGLSNVRVVSRVKSWQGVSRKLEEKYADIFEVPDLIGLRVVVLFQEDIKRVDTCLLYTSPSPRDATLSRMPSSA